MKLAELQAYFARVVTSASGPPADLETVFLNSSQLPAIERMAIYNRAYFYRQVDALRAVFERTVSALGEAEFTRLALTYLAAHPSGHPAIERVGRNLAGYLVGRAPQPVVELAELEWAELTALVAPNPISVAGVADIDPARFPVTRLHFVPSLQVLRGWAVHRPTHSVVREALDPLEFATLSAARSGATMSEVCALFEGAEPTDAAEHAHSVVSRWFASGWVESLEVLGD